MPLTILVVRDRASANATAPNGHSFFFRQSAREGDGIIQLNDFDFVFQHLGPGNPEASQAVSAWVKAGWISKIVGFRGGAVGDEWNSRKIALIPAPGGVIALPWNLVPADYSGDAQQLVQLLQPQSLELLPALAVLCQGFLAVHATETDNIEAWGIGDALRQMGWSHATDAAFVHEHIATVRDPTWWLGVFDLYAAPSTSLVATEIDPGKWARFAEKLGKEWGPNAREFLEGPLMEYLHENKDLIRPSDVADAYLAIIRRLHGSLNREEKEGPQLPRS